MAPERRRKIKASSGLHILPKGTSRPQFKKGDTGRMWLKQLNSQDRREKEAQKERAWDQHVCTGELQTDDQKPLQSLQRSGVLQDPAH